MFVSTFISGIAGTSKLSLITVRQKILPLTTINARNAGYFVSALVSALAKTALTVITDKLADNLARS